jgi:hypothetical protein
VSKFEGLRLSPLTAAIKTAYCDWLRRKMLADAPSLLPAPDALSLRNSILAGGVVFWSKNPSAAVAASLMSPDGLGQLVRLLLGKQVEGVPASDVEALLAEIGTNGPLDVALASALSEGTKEPKPAPETAPAEPQAA